MRMRGKVIAILTLLIAAVLLTRHFISSTVVMPKFLALEQQKGDRDVHRVQMALEMQLEQMADNVEDYAQWDEMFAFLNSRNPAFVQGNLSPWVFDHLRLNCIYIYDADGEKVWGETRDFATRDPQLIPGLPEGEFARLNTLYRRANSPVVLSGFLGCGDRVMYVATSPILSSKGEGPPRGHVVFARLLLPGELEHLSRQVRVNFSLQKGLPDSLSRQDAAAEQGGEILFDCVSDNQLYVYMPLKDLDGKAIQWIKADIPRQISAEGREALRASGYFIGMAGVLILAAAYLCFSYFVVKPVEKLTRHVQWIRQSGDLNNRIHIRRSDEVGVLASEFDLLLTALANDRSSRQRYERRLRSQLQEKAADQPAADANAAPPALPPVFPGGSPENYETPAAPVL
jgi:sensor domain CHASE-containing protein